MVGLIDHLESSLGEIQAGWGKALDGSNAGLCPGRNALAVGGGEQSSDVRNVSLVPLASDRTWAFRGNF